MSLLKSASTVSLLTLASRITGLLRELLMAATFGASAFTDAFNVAFRIPNLLRRLFAEGAFSQAFVPVLAASRAQQGEAQTKQLIDHVATVLAWAVLATSILGVAAAPVLVWLMASGLQSSPSGFEAAVLMTRWMFPYIAFMALVALGAGVLNTYKRFAVPAATPVLLNLCMIGAIYAGAPWFAQLGLQPIYALCMGVLLGGILQLSLQFSALYRLGLMPRIGLTWAAWRQACQHPGTRHILQLMLPALLGVSVAQVSLLINTQIASHLVTGSVSWLTYADRLMEFPVAMLGVALGVVLMPQLAAAKAAQNHERYSSMIDWGLRWVLLLGLPSAVALLVFATPIAAALYHYGRFSANDVAQTSLALAGYGFGLLGLVGIKILAPAYYAQQDIRTPVKIAIAVLLITQLLNLIFVPWLHHAGLALAIGVGALINAGWLLTGLVRSKAYQPMSGWWRFLAQTLAASACMAALLWWAAQGFDWIALQAQALLRVGLLTACVLGAAALYFAVLHALGFRLKAFVRRHQN